MNRYEQKDYEEIRSEMKPGDGVAFSGKGDVSNIIKWATRSGVSHVGMIYQTIPHNLPATTEEMTSDRIIQIPYHNLVMESTSLGGFSGVTTTRLSKRLQRYNGEVWWLPLRKDVREKMDLKKLLDFVLEQEGKPYDVPQAITAGLDRLDKIPFIGAATSAVEDFSKFFCSEFIAGGLRASGVINSINPSEVTPIDICRFNLYDRYVQIKGPPRKIVGFNKIDPEGWGI